jgi:hypothetical protein
MHSRLRLNIEDADADYHGTIVRTSIAIRDPRSAIRDPRSAIRKFTYIGRTV